MLPAIMRSESPLSGSDGDLYRNEEVQLSSKAHSLAIKADLLEKLGA